MSRALTYCFLFAVAAALALRSPEPAVRPMHNDEAVNAIKLRELWDKGSYQYDPQEYHGPTLIYATYLWMKLTGPKDFVDFTEGELRFVPVMFGVGLILLLPLVKDGLGQGTTTGAALLTAISPAMGFYSRYYIHEMLLVFFTFLLLASAWRYTRSRKIGWALLAGSALGLMQATKETFVLALAAMAAAMFLCKLWPPSESQSGAQFQINFKHLSAALGIWLAVVVVLFTSFFTHARGLADAVETYLPWLHRAAGASPHIHPWNFYLARLAFFQFHNGPVWSEGLIIGLAALGAFAAFSRKGLAEGDAGFIRFMALYTVILTILYSAISYKTPWCLLSFWHGMILMAGVGAASLLHGLRKPALRMALGVALAIGAAQLAFQAWSAGVTYASSPINPYVYSQTLPNILELVHRVQAVSLVDPQKDAMLIKVMEPDGDIWPLPWYLRRFNHAGWWTKIPDDPYAPVMIVSTKLQAELDAKKTHIMVGIFQMRPQVFFELYVEKNLWTAHLDAVAQGRSDLKP